MVPVKLPELTVLLLAGSGSLRVRGSPVDDPILRRTIVALSAAVAEPPQTLDAVLTRNGSARAARVLFPKNYALCWHNAECCVASIILKIMPA